MQTMHKSLFRLYLWISIILASTLFTALLISQPTKTKIATKTTIFSSKNTTNNTIKATLVLGGDIMLSRTIGYDNKRNGYDSMFASGGYNPIEKIPSCKAGTCILFFNLESQFSPVDNDLLQQSFLFRANTGNIAVLDALRGQNTMVLSLANNHTNNAGGLGIVTTSHLLDTHGIYHVGAGTGLEEASHILAFDAQGFHWCVAGYSYDGGGGIYGGKPLYRNKINKTSMLADLSTMQSQLRCDVKIMMLHRGIEYRTHPTQDQITLAHILVDSGLDIVVGSHPHVLSTIEHYKGKYIFYSLGNAIFDQDRGMKSVGAGMDTIYDEVLKRNTVPTYIVSLPVLDITKTEAGTKITLNHIEKARLEKGRFETGLLDQK